MINVIQLVHTDLCKASREEAKNVKKFLQSTDPFFSPLFVIFFYCNIFIYSCTISTTTKDVIRMKLTCIQNDANDRRKETTRRRLF